jgi:hypothetical protein
MNNEDWLLKVSEAIIRKKIDAGVASLSPHEHLTYCVWVADYGMRNAGDLEVCDDLYSGFQEIARRIAKELSMNASLEAFSLSKQGLCREYFTRFEAICDELRG